MAPEEQGPVGMHGYMVQFQIINNQLAAGNGSFIV